MKESIIIPGWFAALILAGCITWGAWTTTALIELKSAVAVLNHASHVTQR